MNNNSFEAVGPVLRKRAIFNPNKQFEVTQRNEYTEGQYKKFVYDNSKIGINDTKHSQYRPRHNLPIQDNTFTRPAPVDNEKGAYSFTDKTIEVKPTFKVGTERLEYYGPNSDFAKDNLVKQNYITPIKEVDAEYTAPGVFATHDRAGFAMFSNNKVTDPATGLPLIRGVSVDGGLGYTTNDLIGEDYSFKDKFNTSNPYTNNLNIFQNNVGRRSTPRGYAYY